MSDSHVLTTQQLVDITIALRTQAHSLSQDAALSYLLPERRVEWIAEADRLNALANMLEGKRITVEKWSAP